RRRAGPCRNDAMILKMTLNLPSDAAYVPIVRALSVTLMEQLGIVQEDRYDTSLVIGEICANVVRHAHASPQGHYQVEIDYEVDQIRLIVTDRGKGFDRSAVPPPSLDRSGGWGLWLVENLADHVEFLPAADGGTAVYARLVVRYRSPEAREAACRMS